MLDSAAELLVRWGYQRVTIDDVARHAGIGKGTVYLHFRSKDALFLTVLLRVHRVLAARLAGRMETDAREVLPSRMMRHVYDEMVVDPVARSLYLGDVEVLGKLVHEAADSLGEFTALRQQVIVEHIRLLATAVACARGSTPSRPCTPSPPSARASWSPTGWGPHSPARTSTCAPICSNARSRCPSRSPTRPPPSSNRSRP
ncbi:hypothetical protein BJF90_42885 [Pseudonocardia sp. CNS-004]|nr:hypothetical protein BJF90_42885 [Pseudonocardia sp. CNS-004]